MDKAKSLAIALAAKKAARTKALPQPAESEVELHADANIADIDAEQDFLTADDDAEQPSKLDSIMRKLRMSKLGE